MAFTEFYCRSGGSNLNGGRLSTGAEPSTTAAYTCTNSNWDGTSVFTPTDGSTPASSVTVGDFASVYLDAATVAVYIARVTAVGSGVNGTITLSTTAKSGTAPTSNATGRTIKVGGAWKGPNGASGFPFGFVTQAQMNSSSDPVRVNFKNDAQYNITAAITANVAGPLVFQGYTTSPGDLGKATIDGGTTGASYVLLTNSQKGVIFYDFVFANNGATGSADGIVMSNDRMFVVRCVVHDVRGNGINTLGVVTESEVYGANQSNTASFGGININQGYVSRCFVHDCAGSNGNGLVISAGATTVIIKDSVFESNGGHGITTPNTSILVSRCDFYNNAGSGMHLNPASIHPLAIENCNFVKNGVYGINSTQPQITIGNIQNCGYGSGTQANTSGNVLSTIRAVETGSVTYASGVTPWVDPANGDYRINLAAAKGAGRGAFTQTAASYAGTIGYPDIGAAQHKDIQHSKTFA